MNLREQPKNFPFNFLNLLIPKVQILNLRIFKEIIDEKKCLVKLHIFGIGFGIQ